MKDSDLAHELWSNYQILDEIAKDENLSQRDLAKRAGLALGRTNQVVKRLIRKGLVKTRQINAKRVAYYLTPQGFAEKIHLVMRYAQITINLFSCMREVINHQFVELKSARDVRTVALVGTGELAEAVYLSIQENELDLVAVYDNRSNRDLWFGRKVLRLGEDPPGAVDVVMITEMDDLGRDRDEVRRIGRTVVEVRELLSEQLSLFAKRIAQDDPHRSV